MGRESDVKKLRTCKHCGETFDCSAQPLKSHVALCRRAQASGLVLPGIDPGERIDIEDA